MMEPVIYHGTPLTPRAALEAIMPGRAGCVSFYRPQDLEALLAICPQLMFRSRRIFLLDGSNARREGMGRGQPAGVVGGLLSLARADHLSSWPLRTDAGQPRGTFSDQRWTTERVAIRRSWRAGLPHGCASISTIQALREVPKGGAGMDWAPQARTRWVPDVSSQDGRDRSRDGEQLAPPSYAARHRRCLGLPLFERGCDHSGAERMAV